MSCLHQVTGSNHIYKVFWCLFLECVHEGCVEAIVEDRDGEGEELTASADTVTGPRVEAVGAVGVSLVLENLIHVINLLLDDGVGVVNFPRWGIDVLVKGEESVMEEKVDEALGGKADSAGHIKDLEVGAGKANV